MPWLATAVLLVVWELACIAFDVPEIILPKPTKIFTVFVAALRHPDGLSAGTRCGRR